MNFIKGFFSGKEKKEISNPDDGPLDIKKIAAALGEVIDPETGIDIVELGLVYGINLEGDKASVTMTMTTPACPVAGMLVDMSKESVEKLQGISEAEVELVWQPAWKVKMMSEEAKKQLGWK